jgi:hypothetical protein
LQLVQNSPGIPTVGDRNLVPIRVGEILPMEAREKLDTFSYIFVHTLQGLSDK